MRAGMRTMGDRGRAMETLVRGGAAAAQSSPDLSRLGKARHCAARPAWRNRLKPRNRWGNRRPAGAGAASARIGQARPKPLNSRRIRPCRAEFVGSIRGRGRESRPADRDRLHARAGRSGRRSSEGLSDVVIGRQQDRRRHPGGRHDHFERRDHHRLHLSAASRRPGRAMRAAKAAARARGQAAPLEPVLGLIATADVAKGEKRRQEVRRPATPSPPTGKQQGRARPLWRDRARLRHACRTSPIPSR